MPRRRRTLRKALRSVRDTLDAVVDAVVERIDALRRPDSEVPRAGTVLSATTQSD